MLLDTGPRYGHTIYSVFIFISSLALSLISGLAKFRFFCFSSFVVHHGTCLSVWGFTWGVWPPQATSAASSSQPI